MGSYEEDDAYEAIVINPKGVRSVAVNEMSMTKETIKIYYEDDGCHIAETMQQMMDREDTNLSVTKYVLSNTNPLNPCPVKASVNVIVMTPDLLQAIKDKDDEHYTFAFNSASATIMVVQQDFPLSDTKDIIYKKYKNSCKWKESRMGKTTIAFKKSLLDVLELIDRRNSAPTLKLCSVVPDVIRSVNDRVFVVFRSDVKSAVTVTFLNELGNDITFETTRLNSTMFSFIPKNLTTGEKTLTISVGDKEAGRCSLTIKSKLEVFSDILHDVVSPVSFLCDAMLVNRRDKNALDEDFVDRLTNGFQDNPMKQLLTGNYQENDIVRKSYKQYPTLLHFAAHYGLSRLCEKLLIYPGAEIANRIKNKDGRRPYDLAMSVEERGIAVMLNDKFGESIVGGERKRGSSSSYHSDTDVVNGSTQPPPLPERRSSNKLQGFWSRRMTAVWEGSLPDEMELHFSDDSFTVEGLLESTHL